MSTESNLVLTQTQIAPVYQLHPNSFCLESVRWGNGNTLHSINRSLFSWGNQYIPALVHNQYDNNLQMETIQPVPVQYTYNYIPPFVLYHQPEPQYQSNFRPQQSVEGNNSNPVRAHQERRFLPNYNAASPASNSNERVLPEMESNASGFGYNRRTIPVVLENETNSESIADMSSSVANFPIYTNVMIQGQQVKFKVNTSITTSLCSVEHYNRYFRNNPFTTSYPLGRRNSHGRSAIIVRVVPIQVVMHSRVHTVNINVEDKPNMRHPIMGRKWIDIAFPTLRDLFGA